MKLNWKETLLDIKKIYKTPRGEALWAHLITPQTKFDPAGVYQISMRFTSEREKEFLAQMEELYEAAYLQTCQETYKTQLPREKPPWKRDSDGRMIFKFKLKASGVFDGQPWQNHPPKLYDAAAKRIEDPDSDELRIGNSSEVRAYFQVRPYFVQKAGITLRLKAVQLLKLVEYDEAKHFCIEDEDDGDGCYRRGTPAPAPAPKTGTVPQTDTPVDIEQLTDDEKKATPVADTREIADNDPDDDIPF